MGISFLSIFSRLRADPKNYLAVALIMALDRAIMNYNKVSVYNERGI